MRGGSPREEGSALATVGCVQCERTGIGGETCGECAECAESERGCNDVEKDENLLNLLLTSIQKQRIKRHQQLNSVFFFLGLPFGARP